MKFEIIPYEGVGPIKLGMKPVEVGNAMKSSEVTADYFYEFGITVDYDENNECCRVYLCKQANPIFQGQNLLNGRCFNSLCEWFRSIDDSTTLGDIEMISFKFGIGLFANSSIKYDGNKRPKEVVIFRGSFFDYLLSIGQKTYRF
jgi:hypothetical protein